MSITSSKANVYFDYFKDNKYIRYCEEIILGFLSYRNLSGYDIAKLINDNKTIFSGICRINKASIYDVISRLEKEKFIVLKEIIAEDKKPPKHLYDITEKGKLRLNAAIMDDLSNAPLIFSNIFFDVIFMKFIDIEKIKPYLVSKLKQLRDIERVVSQLNSGEPIVSSLIRKYEAEIIQLNIRMLEEFLDSLSRNRDFFKLNCLTEEEIKEVLEK
ncbi:MAG: Helix-turn-helix transcriptional regulator [Thermoproteota archaeon]|nr:Helix-turn-helix transcriptional regulator [Thermoproteota archaeon]